MQSTDKVPENAHAHSMRTVLDRAPSMLAYWDRESRCRFANRAYERWFGVDPQGLVGTSIKDLLGPTQFALHEPHIRAVLRGEDQTFQRTVPGPDGVLRQCLAHYLPNIVDGEVQGFVVQVTDVTLLKETEACLRSEAAEHERVGNLLRESEATLRQTQRLVRIGSWHWEACPDITTWSEELYRIFGRDPTQLPPSYAEHGRIYAAQSWPVLQAAVARTLASGDPYILELEYVRPDGATGWIEACGEAERDERGAIVGLHGTVQEITVRRNARQARRDLATSEHFRARLEALTPGVISVFDLERQCTVYINRAVAPALGYSPEEVSAMGADVVPTLMHPEDQLRFGEHLGRMRAARDDETADFEFRMRNRAGAWRWFQSRDAVFSRNALGEVRELIGTAIEMGPLRQTEQSLRDELDERKRAGVALQQSEAEFRAVFEQSAVGISQVSAKTGRWTLTNAKFCELTGYTAEELKQMSPTDIDFADDHQADAKALGQFLRGETALYESEKRYERKDGEIIWVHVNATLLRDADGHPERGLAVVQDITARKRSEEQLRASEERYRATFALAPLGIAHVGLDGSWLRFNEALCAITGYGSEKLATLTFGDITHPDDLEADWAQARRLVAGEIAHYSMEKRYIRANGDFVWVNLTVSLARDADGAPAYFISMIEDINKRREAAEALRVSEKFSSAVLESSPDCMKVLDGAGRLQFMNANGACLLEIDDFANFRGQPWWNLWPETSEATVRDAVERASCGETVHFQMFGPTVKGTPKWWDVMVAPVAGKNGEDRAPTLISVARDVTAQHTAALELRVSEERLALGIELAEIALAEVDYSTGLNHLTPRAARLFGLGDAAMVVPRAQVHATFHPKDREELERRIAHCLDPAGSGCFVMDHRVVWPGGEVRWISVRIQILFTGENSSRRPQRAILAMLDVTNKKAAEAALLASHTRMRLAAEATAVGFWEWHLPSNTIRWDAQMFRLYGIRPTPDGFVQYSDWRGAMLAEDLLENERFIQDTVLQGGQSRREFRIKRREDGDVRDIEGVETVRLNERGEAEWVLGTNLDITDRNRAKRSLQQSAAQLESEVKLRTSELRELAVYLQTVREEEKASLARELHDELGGLLTAVKLDLARIRVKVAHDTAVVERLAQANNRLNEGIELKRRVIENLRPSALTNLGLAASLRILCSETSAGLGIPIQAEIDEFSADPDTELTIYRVLQESLTNISKYASAHEVRVRLCTLGETVQLAVTDDGAGFDPNQSSTGRHGITGMRFRVASLGGTLTLDSARGRGTTLVAAFPLQSITGQAGLADSKGS